MANNANKKIIVKKDMNFFAEFTASAAKAARLLTYAVLFGIAVVGIILVGDIDLIGSSFAIVDAADLKVIGHGRRSGNQHSQRQ